MGRLGLFVNSFAFWRILIVALVGTLFLSLPASTPAQTSNTIRVNCGGPAYTTTSGVSFVADQEFTGDQTWGYVGGRTGSAPKGSVATANDLFLTDRWGLEKYCFQLQPGIYRVAMYFSEAHFSAPLQRVFDVWINHRKILSRLDIFAAAGGQGKALVISRLVSTDDGKVVVAVQDLKDKAKFSAIAIEPATPEQIPPAAPSNLVAYVRDAEIGLDWSPVAEEDMFGYHVYRSFSPTGDFEKATTTPVQDAFWIDRETENTGAYFYALSTVDFFGNESVLSAPVEAAPSFTNGIPTYGINVGGASLTDERGRRFLADREYNPANAFGFVTPGTELSAPQGTAAEPYRSFREGPLAYRLDLPPGPYQVTLGFFDPYSRESRLRVFSVFFNEFRALDRFDLFEQYGSRLPAEVQRVFLVKTNGLEISLKPDLGGPLLSFIYAAPAETDQEAPQTPVIQKIAARDEVVCVDWTPSPETDVVGYQVLRAVGQPDRFQPLSNGWTGVNRWVDRQVLNGEKYFYRVAAYDASGNTSAPSDFVEALPHFPSDDELLDLVSRGAFEFFLREHDPKTFLTKDKNTANTISVAATGFGLTALCIGAERQWIVREEAERRAYLTLRALNGMTNNQSNGIFFHYLQGDGSRGGGGYEDVASTVDAALLAWGALAAGEYFGGRIEDEAALMVARMNWKFFADSERRLLAMAYHPLNGRFDGAWDYYTDEALLIAVLGIGAPNPAYRIDPSYFYTFKRDRKSYQNIDDIVCTWPGAFFTYSFAHAWIDFQALGPDQPEKAGMPADLQVNWWSNSVKAALANKAFCMSLTNQFKTFGENAWGLTACSGPGDRYMVCGAPPSGGGIETGEGTLALYGAGMAVPFIPDDAIAALKHYYTLKDETGRKLLWKDEFEGGYGLIDAYNLDKNWFSQEIHGINHGPMLLMIENHRTGLIWELMLKNKTIREALTQIFSPKKIY